MLLNCGVGKDSWESLGLQGDPTSPSWRKSVLNIHWKDWYWRWNSSTLATSCEELTHWKSSWCWERLKSGREGDDRGWDGWMASLTRWTWIEATPGAGDGQGRLVCCSPWGRKESDMTKQLNWTDTVVLSLFSHIQLFATLWTVAHQAPLSMGFCRQEYWGGLSCPLPGNLPNLWIESRSLMLPVLAGRFFTTKATWEAQLYCYIIFQL